MTPNEVRAERVLVESQWDGARSTALLQPGKLQMESDEQQAITDTPALADQATVAPEVVEELLEELTEEEADDRHRLELRVERAFYEAGCALRELRDRRLYRSTHKSWEDYCRDRFEFTRFSANLKILAVSVVDDLVTNGHQILPTNERQIRPITNLKPDERSSVWQQAVEEAGSKVPSGRIVKGIVERLKERQLPQLSISYKPGDVFRLAGLSGSGRKYNGCWAIAIGVNNFTLEVEVHDAVLTVKPDNLNQIDSPDVRRQLPSILIRIKRLRQCDLDRGAYPILEFLGQQTYLTDFEADLLAFMEQRYGIDT